MRVQFKRFCTRFLSLLALGTVLAGCSSDDRELQAYIDQIKARPGTAIPPLPEIKPAPSFVYEDDGRRSPFISDRAERVSANPNAVTAPDPNRPREFLEQVPLDSLTMVGTLRRQNEGAMYGLVRAPDGRIHRVTVGNYMGQNYGRITAISAAEIELVERIPDARGDYIERPAGIALQ